MIKKITGLLLLTVCMQQAIAQTETFDIVTYKPPKNWRRDSRQGVITYADVNTATGSYCVIAIYAGLPSAGDAQKDFQKEWKDLAVDPYKANPYPQPEKVITSSGWKQYTAASAIKQDSLDALVILSVFSGFGKKTSLLFNMNDKAYLPLIDSLLAGVTLDKSKLVPVAVAPVPAAGTTTDITGVWSDYSGTIGNYVNGSGGIIGSADTHEMNEYTFKPDRTFSYRYFGSTGVATLYVESSGYYVINGENITLQVKLYRIKVGAAGQLRENKSKEVQNVYKFYIGPNKWEPGPFLNMHKDGDYYPWSDYPYKYYKKQTNTARP